MTPSPSTSTNFELWRKGPSPPPPLAGGHLHGRELEPAHGQVVEVLLGAGHEVPALVRVEGRGIAGEHLRRVVGGIDGERHERHVRGISRRRRAMRAVMAGQAPPHCVKMKSATQGRPRRSARDSGTAGALGQPEVGQRAQSRRLRRAAEDARRPRTATAPAATRTAPTRARTRPDGRGAAVREGGAAVGMDGLVYRGLGRGVSSGASPHASAGRPRGSDAGAGPSHHVNTA
jgi:hypothetical protein